MDEPDLSVPSDAPAPAWVELGRWLSAARAEDHALVLHAVGIRYAIAQVDSEAGPQHALIVEAADADRARDQIARFVRENKGWPPKPVEIPPLTSGVGAALVYAALLVIVFAAQEQGSWGVDWLRTGSADAALMRGGEWWRSVTALTLHGDVVHLVGNIVFGALFGVMLAQSLGAGTAWLVFVTAGAIGNFVNAWWQLPEHIAIGASTGVFGLLGAQAAVDWMRRGRVRLHPLRRWAPIIMGVALLAWFGGSGETRVDPREVTNALRSTVPIARVDIAAHVFGFVAGLGLGAMLAIRAAARLHTPRAQAVLTAATIGIVALAWALAVR